MARMKFEWLTNRWKTSVWFVVLVSIGVLATVKYAHWKPHADNFMAYIQNKDLEPKEDEEDAADALSETPDTLTLTPQAWKNIGLVTDTVSPSNFVKVVSVPAIVVDRPGRSQIQISAPMTGIVTQVYPLERQAIEPGDALFTLRLTHEDVVTAQSEFLTQLQSLDVINKELVRLKRIGEGVIPGKRIIEQEYKRDEAQTSLAATRQSLLLHGMSKVQVADIEKTRELLRDITVVAPPYAKNHEHAAIQHQYHVQAIRVARGQSVQAGDLLGVLGDHCLLYVEGKAFEDDANRLMEASENGCKIRVTPVSGDLSENAVLDLAVQSVSDQVDTQSRALKFYLLLPNQLKTGANGNAQRFVSWKYRPGQRMEARIPTSEVMKNKIVLPPNAVVIEGPNAFVFEQNGDNFDRIDVHVLYRDKDVVVLENDGQLVGSVIALNGAYEMHLALKNQSGGAIDPHAGHNH